MRGGDVAEALAAAGLDAAGSPFPAPLALNVVPWAGSLKDDGWSLRGAQGPQRVPQDPRHPGPARSRPPACAFPVVTTHSLAVHATFARECRWRRPARCSPSSPRSCCATTRRPASGRRPADAVGGDPTWVGRIRQALDFPNTLELFVCGDNLRKGAALNTYEIAETVAISL